MTDVSLSFAVMAHPDRDERVKNMLGKLDLEEAVEYDTCFDADRTGKAWTTARWAWEHALKIPSTHHMVLQDDLGIPRNFLRGVKNALTAQPGNPMSLFTAARSLRNAEKGASFVALPHVSWAQALILPTPLVSVFLSWCEENIHPDYRSDDVRFSMFCLAHSFRVLHTVPCLVEHDGHAEGLTGNPVKTGNNSRRAALYPGDDADAAALSWDGPVVKKAGRSLGSYKRVPRVGDPDGTLQDREDKDRSPDLTIDRSIAEEIFEPRPGTMAAPESPIFADERTEPLTEEAERVTGTTDSREASEDGPEAAETPADGPEHQNGATDAPARDLDAEEDALAEMEAAAAFKDFSRLEMPGLEGKMPVYPMGQVTPYWRNPRNITQEAVDSVAASIYEYGYNQPIVVDRDLVIIVGHTRYKACQKLGVREVAVLVRDDLPAALVKEYRLADNASGEKSKWAEDKLTAEIRSLHNVRQRMAVHMGDDRLKSILDAARGAQAAVPNQQQIADREEKLKGSFKDRDQEHHGGYVELDCPECGESFFVQKSDFLKRLERMNAEA